MPDSAGKMEMAEAAGPDGYLEVQVHDQFFVSPARGTSFAHGPCTAAVAGRDWDCRIAFLPAEGPLKRYANWYVVRSPKRRRRLTIASPLRRAAPRRSRIAQTGRHELRRSAPHGSTRHCTQPHSLPPARRAARPSRTSAA